MKGKKTDTIEDVIGHQFSAYYKIAIEKFFQDRGGGQHSAVEFANLVKYQRANVVKILGEEMIAVASAA